MKSIVLLPAFLLMFAHFGFAQQTRGSIRIVGKSDAVKTDNAGAGLFVADATKKLASRKVARLPWDNSQVTLNVTPEVRVGGKLRIDIHCTGPNHIRLFQFGADGSTVVLLPNRFDLETKIQGNKHLPNLQYDLITTAPAGPEVIALVVSEHGFADEAAAQAAARKEGFVDQTKQVASAVGTRGGIKLVAKPSVAGGAASQLFVVQAGYLLKP